MKKLLPLILILCLVKLAIHLIGNGNYGFHRDELLHLSAGEHLARGYMEFPPFIAFMGKLATSVFGYSVSGVRFFVTLAGIGLLALTCAIAYELGGGKKAVLLVGICVLGFLPYFRNHLLFQPVGFEQFFWTLGFYCLLKFIKTKQAAWAIALGITAGLGLLTKYTMLIWGGGLVVGLLFFDKGRIFRDKWLYIAGIIAILILLPNIIWQWQHHFPIALHYQKLKEAQLSEISPAAFGKDQLKLPFTFIISLIGAVAFFINPKLKPYKALSVSVIFIFVTMWILQSKSYYFFAAYPVLFAAGSVQIEQWFTKRPVWNYVVAAILILPVIPFVPDAIPVLPVEKYVAYKHLKPGDDGRVQLTSDYADMFGWNDMVQVTDSVYRSLPPADKEQAVILASNYGEAGAVFLLGKKYSLPEPVCSHGSFWLWGPGNKRGDVLISIGKSPDDMKQFFGEVTLVKKITHPYTGEENNTSVCICRKPRISLQQVWPGLEKKVFD